MCMRSCHPYIFRSGFVAESQSGFTDDVKGTPVKSTISTMVLGLPVRRKRCETMLRKKMCKITLLQYVAKQSI